MIDKKQLAEWYKQLGKKGGKSRAKKYSKKQLTKWARLGKQYGKLGGRPRKDKSK